MHMLLLQGRGIETNLYAQFKCDSLKIGMVINLSYNLNEREKCEHIPV